MAAGKHGLPDGPAQRHPRRGETSTPTTIRGAAFVMPSDIANMSTAVSGPGPLPRPTPTRSKGPRGHIAQHVGGRLRGAMVGASVALSPAPTRPAPPPRPR